MADAESDNNIPTAEEIPEDGEAVSDESAKTAVEQQAEPDIATANGNHHPVAANGLASKKLLLISSGVLSLLIVLSGLLIYFTLQMEFNALFENQQQAANKKSPLANDINHLITLNNDIYDTLYNLSEQIQSRINGVISETTATKNTMNDVIDAVVELQTLVNKSSGKTTVAMKRLRQHLNQIKKHTQNTQNNVGDLQKTLEKLRHEPVRVIREVGPKAAKSSSRKRRHQTSKRPATRLRERRRAAPQNTPAAVSPVITAPTTAMPPATAEHEAAPYTNNNPFFGSSIINAPPVSWNILPAID